MRRLLWILLMILLLVGCKPVATVPPVESSPPVVTSPVETPPAETTTPPIVFTHEKFDPGETDNPRWYAETTLELIPRDDYGELYPYPDSLRHWTWRGDVPVAEFSLYGLCTADGTIVCDPAFSDVQRYEYEGKACYVLRRVFGYGEDDPIEETVYLVASDGRFALETNGVGRHREGVIAVNRGGKWGAVDFDGKEILPCIYEYFFNYSEGLAAVSKDFSQGYSYVNLGGETVFSMPPFPRENLEILRDSEWFDGARYTMFFDMLEFHEGRAAFFTPERLYGFLDMRGRIVIEAKYGAPDGWWNVADRFYDGTVTVTAGKRQFVIDSDGNEVPDAQPARYYERAPDNPPSPHLFGAGERYGYMDAMGTILLPAVYDELREMGGYFMVRQGLHGGLINSGGEWVVKRFMTLGDNGD